MWRVLSVLVVVCVVCLFSVKSQTVNEAESSVSLSEKLINVALMMESVQANPAGKLTLELLDADNKVRSQITENVAIKKGKEAYKLALSLGDWSKSVDDDLVWYRLRYRVGNSQGIVSLSQLLKDDFELRVAAGNALKPGINYRIRARALQPYTGVPVRNVRLAASLKLELNTEADEDELNLTASGETDAEGFTYLDFKIPENIRLKDDGELKVTGSKSGIIRTIEEDIDSLEFRGSVFLTADKPIYQPGQTFNVRGLYFDENQNVMPDSELKFKISDEDGTALYRETVKTSAFGIASISWKIPDNAKLGSYRVEVEADSDLYADTMRFKVTRYDLPNFSVVAKPDKTFYLPGDKKAEIAVRADYLFGKPVTQGRVRVVQENERRWNYKEQKYDTEEKQKFEGELNAEGKFIASADLSEGFKNLTVNDWRRYEDLHFAAYFTDLTTNKTEQKRFDVRLSKEPIHIYFIKGSKYNVKLPSTAYISTFYADGTPAICDVEVKGKYEDSEDFKILTQTKTNSFGAGKITFSPPPSEDSDEDYELKITARDTKQQSGTFSEDIDYDEDDVIQIKTEKTIFKPGEAVKVSLASTKKDALVYLDVVQNWKVVDSYFIKLKNNRAELKIPYNPDFKGDLVLAAYTDDDDDESYHEMKASRGVIFPAQQNLQLAANFSNTTYKPNEQAKVNFSVVSGEGKPLESALGVVIFDKAVEERARTDADFGSYFSQFYGWLGYDQSFGGVKLKDLNDLNLSKPVSADLQLAAEIMLADNSFYPHIYRSKIRTDVKRLYADSFKRQFAPVEAALSKEFNKNFIYPTDEAQMKKILRENGIDFDALRDPWGQPYRPVFSLAKSAYLVMFYTAGVDKTYGNADDFSVSSASFSYFTPVGNKINEAVKNFHRRTGGYIRDYETLRTELLKQDIDLDTLRDRWNHPYRIIFETSRRNYVIRFHSVGEDGIYDDKYWGVDDFDIWTNSTDYFVETEINLNEILSQVVNRDKKPFPQNDADFRKLLQENGINLDTLRDGYGNPVYLTVNTQTRYADKTKIENGKQTITPVTQEVVIFKIRSSGQDLKNDYDDFDLAEFSSIITEKSKDTLFSKAEIRNIAASGAKGAIRGTITDASGAVIPGATVTATEATDSTKTFSTTSTDNGEFLLSNVPSGKYTVRIGAANFKAMIYDNIEVRSQNLVEMTVTLEVGTVSEVVSITSDAEVSVNTTSASIASVVSSSQIKQLPKNAMDLVALQPGVVGRKNKDEITQTEENSTPRLREYFPETLVWSPELITDKYGKAEMKFKLADNITTWKLYTIASSKNGKIGIAEKEIQAFQPFFVDLEPPKFLTEGDEIYFPSQIRNYTDKKQKVNVSMAKGDWFSFLNSANQTIDVASGASENAVFGFKTLTPIKDGKQRVTAIAAKDSDAIEKPVTVRPNGEEIVQTESKLFQNSADFDVNFPLNALPKTPKAELKIYPNLMAHVTESVEGLLQRPYGCGEQTISSTYPNLMILKFTKADSKLRPTAQKYLQKGYERLIGYQVADGGFSYWGGKDSSDIALTAYAIRFLTEAGEFITVDEDIVDRAKEWLIKQQRADGSFTKKYYYETAENSKRTKLFTAYVARILAMQKEKDDAPLQKALAYLKTRNQEIDEPYTLALFALASQDAGNIEEAKQATAQLKKMAIPEGTGTYWNLETNTPFYGWGTAGRIETTALVVQALIKEKAEDKATSDLISKGTMFLLKAKDRYGVWYSTQTTINVLDAFLASLAQNQPAENQNLQVLLNGQSVQNITVSNDKIEPIILDLSGKIGSSGNRLEVKSSSNVPVMAQIVSSHYIDWKDSTVNGMPSADSVARMTPAQSLRLDYKCDKTNAKIMEDVSCSVGAERVGFQGYGMLLAEIGIPPGADVSRESLQEAMKNDWSLSRYDVLPDRIVLYMWVKGGGTKFNFKFKPRYGINAQTPASIVYDYYNAEAKTTVAPLRFSVK